MLFVAFRIGCDRYVLATDVIVEVLPGLQLKPLPGTPRGVAGLCNYRGRPVPVIDPSPLVTAHVNAGCTANSSPN